MSKPLLVQYIVIFTVLLAAPATSHAALSRSVVGDLVYWDQTRGLEVIQQNVDLFSEVSPFWYSLDASGAIVPYSENGISYEDPAIVSYLRSHQIAVTPTITNLHQSGVWDGALVSRIITSSSTAAKHVQAIVDLVVAKGYDGADIDYEDLSGSDRAAFSAFIQNLATALHAAGKTLSVNVYGKTSEPGTWGGPQAQDWAAIGKAADEVRIMTYIYSWSTSPPGPIDPIDWYSANASLAVNLIPARKVLLGVPFFGLDWPLGVAASDGVWSDWMSTARAYGATVTWDPLSASPTFQYVKSSTAHTVWFENASSTSAKLAKANSYNAGGIFLWRLGGEDPATWQVVRSSFASSTAATSTTPALSVTITTPRSGATLAGKQKIAASISGSSATTKVEFYVDTTLLATDWGAPYVAYWNTRKASAGEHIIRVVAYDAIGNTAAAQITVQKSLASSVWGNALALVSYLFAPIGDKLAQMAAVTLQLLTPPPTAIVSPPQ